MPEMTPEMVAELLAQGRRLREADGARYAAMKRVTKCPCCTGRPSLGLRTERLT